MTDTQKPDWKSIGLLILAVVMFLAGWAAHGVMSPVSPVAPTPAPIPAPIPAPTPEPPLITPVAPSTPLKLTIGELYVADAKYDSFLIASPPELVTITRKEAPITIHSKIVPGTGKLETRKFNGPAVFTVEAAGTGRCELLLIKAGAKGPADVEHRLLDVDSGEGPRPPPDPPKPPPEPPKPPPEPPPPVVGPLKVLMIYDADPVKRKAYTPGQRAVLDSTKVLSYLNSHCAKGPDGKTPEWRVWADNANASADSVTWQSFLARPRKGLPWLVVSNGSATGYDGPLPGNVDEMLLLLQTYGGP